LFHRKFEVTLITSINPSYSLDFSIAFLTIVSVIA
jgi:hypothetical protein